MNGLSRIVAGAATTAATVAARRGLEFGWRTVKGDDPPIAESLSSDADLRDLFVWSALLLVAVLLARKLAGSATQRLLG